MNKYNFVDSWSTIHQYNEDDMNIQNLSERLG